MGVGEGLSWRASAGKPASWGSLEGEGGVISGLFSTVGILPYCSADGPVAAYGEKEGEGTEPDAAYGDASWEHACRFCAIYGVLRRV